ncbi:MAG TPA: sensory protein TspO [Rhodobacteraceae bacterium]|jgi:benzodiazapine receptor|nr:tryptophan-rich sensory protein [Paracoccaceae bacterium]HBG98497.1 sensory protein TspO [Paracoccaceae bacterium]
MDLAVFLVFLASCMGAAATGAIFSPGDWYERLNKPSWIPPNWAFPVTWTVLYVLIAVAATRIAALPGDTGLALAFWSLQIVMNALWSPVFFGLHRIRAGMLVLVFLWLSVAGTLWSFAALDPIAAAMIAPYLLWVTIAGALNLSVWRLNPVGEMAARG